MDNFWNLLNEDKVEGLNPIEQQNHTCCSMEEIIRFDELTGDRRKTLDILAIGCAAGRSYREITTLYLSGGDTPAFRRAILDSLPVDKH